MGKKLHRNGGSSNRGVKPRGPETKAEREGRVVQLELNPGGDVTLQSGQPVWFTAVPKDYQGSAVHGLRAEWESSNKQVISIRKTGQAVAGKPGRATLTAKAGALRGTVSVTVDEGNKEPFGGKKKQDSVRTGRQIGQNQNLPNGPAAIAMTRKAAKPAKRHHGNQVTPRTRDTQAKSTVNPKASSSSSFLPLRPPEEDPLPDGETGSLYQPGNLTGSPPGKSKPGAMTPPVAIEGTETNGSQNYSFGLPIVGMAGRGVNVSLSLAYNSQLWNKSTSGGNTYLTYDVDSAWPAPGFRIGFGQIEDQGSYGFTLTDADGTRHALVSSGGNNYDTTDGTFIHFYGGSGWGTLYYPDGTIVYYGAAGGGYRSYPTGVVDRNGNYFGVAYVGRIGPRISYVIDTLERYVDFHYASIGDLVSITAPGLTGQSDL